jgi:hypothetical protein
MNNVQNSIVSIWSGKPNQGEYLGCGVCITPDMIITAGHVIHEKEDLYVGLIPGRDSGISVNHIERHKIDTKAQGKPRDIALVTLSGEHGKPTNLCSFSKVFTAGAVVTLVAYNSSEKCVKGPVDVTINNWAEPGSWELNTELSPGMSGGGVFFQGGFVGVIQARDEQQKSGIFIPFGAVKDFIHQHVPDAVPSSGGKAPEVELLESDITKKLREEIATTLNSNKISVFVDALAEYLDITKSEHEKGISVARRIAKKLPGKEFSEAIIEVLLPATVDCVRKDERRYPEPGDTTVSIDAIRRASKEVLGWLLLNTIDGHRFSEAFAAGGTSPLSLSVVTPTGVEIILARKTSRAAAPEVQQAEYPQSPYEQSISAKHLSEDSDEAVNTILLELWNTVFMYPTSQKMAGDTLEESEISFLKATLEGKRKNPRDKKHYFISGMLGNSPEDENLKLVAEKLHAHLPADSVILYGGAGQSALFLIDEHVIVAAVNEYLDSVKKE